MRALLRKANLIQQHQCQRPGPPLQSAKLLLSCQCPFEDLEKRAGCGLPASLVWLDAETCEVHQLVRPWICQGIDEKGNSQGFGTSRLSKNKNGSMCHGAHQCCVDVLSQGSDLRNIVGHVNGTEPIILFIPHYPVPSMDTFELIVALIGEIFLK